MVEVTGSCGEPPRPQCGTAVPPRQPVVPVGRPAGRLRHRDVAWVRLFCREFVCWWGSGCCAGVAACPGGG
jgi:hypothetical protein